jgi:polysaccharide biosynthesis protein PslG
MADVGARWVRLDMSWADVETSRGARNSGVIAMTDRAVQMSRAAGVRVLLVVANAPGWASGSSNKAAPPQNPADYANFMSWVVNRYRGQIEAYEVWNEENTTRFWPTGVNPGQYANLLKTAYPAIKQQDPAAKVLFGGLALNDYAFVEAAYAAEPNLGSYYDVMATHPYTTVGNEAPETIVRGADGRIEQNHFPAYREVRATMLAHGTDKPIWFTEMGWATFSGGVTEATQADYLTRAFRYMEQDPYVQVAVWYNFRNNYWAGDANTWEDSLGLMHTDFSHKPAYDAFKNYTPGTSTPAPAPAPAPTSDPAPAPAPAPEPAPAPTNGRGKKRTSTKLRVSGSTASSASRANTSVTRRRLRRFVIAGNVTSARSGLVVLRFQRRVGRSYRTVTIIRTSVSAAGAFTRSFSNSQSGAWRVQATYSGSADSAPSVSRYAYFRV